MRIGIIIFCLVSFEKPSSSYCVMYRYVTFLVRPQANLGTLITLKGVKECVVHYTIDCLMMPLLTCQSWCRE